MILGSIRLAGYTITAIDGGGCRMDGGAVFGVVPKPLWSVLTPADDKNRVRLSFFSLLVQDGTHSIVIEGGSAVHLPPKIAEYHCADSSSLVATLEKLGVPAGEVGFFIPTHLHFDHVGGAVEGPDGPTFPNAAYLVQRAELEEARDPMPVNRNAYQPGDIEPLENARLQILDGDEEILPGLKVQKTGGHSVGHQSVQIGTGAERLVFAGDLIPTSEHISPRWMCAFDIDPAETYQRKVDMLDRAACEGSLIAAGHGGANPIFCLERSERGRFEGVRVPSISSCPG